MNQLNKNQLINSENDILVKVLTQWQDHDKQLVLDAYRELNSRNFFVPGKNSILTDLLIDKSISSFCSAHRISNVDEITETQLI
jgi:hypothetical protein